MNSTQLNPNATLVDILRFRAIHQPHHLCCTFLEKEIKHTLNYAELDQQARLIAARLQAQGIQPGARILLLFAPGLPLITAFFACLYAGCVAVPIYPPGQNKLMDKASRIVENATPSAALMTTDHQMKFAPEGLFHDLPCINVDAIDPSLSDDWQPLLLMQDQLAFLQYTSGSTMHPKGVMISHQNLLDNLDRIYTHYHMNQDSIMFSWLPPHHDMGLIGCILAPIYGGFPTIMMSPFSFLQNPLSWLKHVSDYRATISVSPNFAFDYCVKRIKEEKKQGLDLSSWHIASNGSEPIRAETMNHFYEAFKDYGFKKKAFFPCYGLAEATLLVTCGIPGQSFNTLSVSKDSFHDHEVHLNDEDGAHTLVSCGHLIQEVKIVNPDTLELCPAHEIGEIWVHSPSVAQGYWKQPEETAHAFQAQIKDDSKIGYLRTGDLGFIHDSELYVTGRIKDLIILYGKNHYPQDIEYTVMHAPIHTQLGKCAAFVMQVDDEYKLVLMCEIKNRFIDSAEQEALFNTLFQLIYQTHLLEVHRLVLIPLKAMPHTTSGKIRRNFCRNQLLDGTLTVVADWQLEKQEAE